MSYTSLLINSASVYRYPAGGAPDPYGTPAKVWAVVPELSDTPCRITPVSGIEIKVGAELVVADYKLFLGNVTLTEQDKVYVYWGTIDAWVEYEILQVMDRQDGIDSHHKECFLRTAR